MAYHVEKTAAGQDLVINGWTSGIGSSPETGLGLLRGVSLEIPGEVSAGWPVTQQTISGGTLDKLTFGAVDYSVAAGTGNGTYSYYMLDATGQAWGSTGTGTWVHLGNTTTGATATNQGIVVWHNYIFVFRNGSIDYAATNNPTSWTSGWKSITGSTRHYAIVAQNNDVIYFCNGNQIGSIAWNGGAAFDPTSAGTYTFNAAALLLPFDEQSTCLDILGTFLEVGGFSNRIYPWDRVSNTYNAPILLPENFVWRLVNANNFLYIFMGNQVSRGRIYVTSGSAVTEFFKMPDFLANSVEPYWLWGGAIWWRNYLLFGVQAYQNSGDTVLTGTTNVWALKLGISLLGSTEQNFSAISPLSTGTQLATVLLPDVRNTSIGGWDYFIGADDNGVSATYQILSPFSNGGNTFPGTVESDIIPVGTSIQQKTFAQAEFKLSRPLTTGESIQIFVRTDLNASYVSQGTTSTTGLFAPLAPFSFTVEKLQWIQVQVSLTGNTNGSHVRLTEIRLR